MSKVRSFLCALVMVLATPLIASAQVLEPPAPPPAGVDPQQIVDRPLLGGLRTNGPSLCPAPRGQTVLAILDDLCWLMTTHNAQTDAQGYVIHTQWWAYFQPGPRFNSQSLVGWVTLEVVFDCEARRVVSAAKVSVHDPDGVLVDSRRETMPSDQLLMYRARQNVVMHEQLCAQ